MEAKGGTEERSWGQTQEGGAGPCRHLHLRRRIPTAVFQPGEQARRAMRYEGPEGPLQAGQDGAGAEPGAGSGFHLPSAAAQLCRRPVVQTRQALAERRKATLGTQPVHPVILPGPQRKARAFPEGMCPGVSLGRCHWRGALREPHLAPWGWLGRPGEARGRPAGCGSGE